MPEGLGIPKHPRAVAGTLIPPHLIEDFPGIAAHSTECVSVLPQRKRETGHPP